MILVVHRIRDIQERQQQADEMFRIATHVPTVSARQMRDRKEVLLTKVEK